MATITTINETDLISTSRTDINNNFSALNTDKIETSVLDTDTALTANSDSKIATQKAVKAYVDSGGQQNASETIRGLVEEATDAEITAGTDTGATGAKLFAPPSKLNTQIDTKIAAATPSLGKVMGTLENSFVKTYFNWQLPFIVATGTVNGATTTDFPNWTRSNAADVATTYGYGFCHFSGNGAESNYIQPFIGPSMSALIQFNSTNIVVLDWFAKLPATAASDFNMGFVAQASDLTTVYNSSIGAGKVAFTFQGSTGKIFATIFKNGVGVTNTECTGVTNTVWNNFRIEFDISNNALFYINGVLKATLSGANLQTGASDVFLGFGRSGDGTFTVTAPNLSLQMNP